MKSKTLKDMKALGLDNMLGFCVNKSALLLTKIVFTNIKNELNLALTMEELAIMSRVYERDKLSMKEIAELTLKDKSTISRLIKPLETKNLIKRFKDKYDSRVVLVKLTPSGIKQLNKIVPIIFKVLTAATRDIPIHEVKKSIKTLNLVNTNIENLLRSNI